MTPIYVTAYTADNQRVPKRQWEMAPGGYFSLEEWHFTPPASVLRGKLRILSPRGPAMRCKQPTQLSCGSPQAQQFPLLGQWIHLVLPQFVLTLFYCKIVFKENKFVNSIKPKGLTFDCKFWEERENVFFSSAMTT